MKNALCMLLAFIALPLSADEAIDPEAAMMNLLPGWMVQVIPLTDADEGEPAEFALAAIPDRGGAPYAYDWFRGRGLDWFEGQTAYRFEGWYRADHSGSHHFVLEFKLPKIVAERWPFDQHYGVRVDRIRQLPSYYCWGELRVDLRAVVSLQHRQALESAANFRGSAVAETPNAVRPGQLVATGSVELTPGFHALRGTTYCRFDLQNAANRSGGWRFALDPDGAHFNIRVKSPPMTLAQTLGRDSLWHEMLPMTQTE